MSRDLPCSCEGTNSNCRWCYGTGIRKATDDDAQRVPGRRRHAQGPPVPVDRWTRPLEPVEPSGCRAHEGAASTVGTAVCSICHRVMPVQRLQKHLKSARPRHRRRATGAAPGHHDTRRAAGAPVPQATLVRAADIPAGFEPCPHCRFPIRRTLLPEHIARAHGRPRSRDTGRRRSSPDEGASSAGRQGGAGMTASEGAEQRRLDATRDYWPIRESGRFGSHSSHDDFGDDSTP
jgi:hypothetical protein